ncbi:MAG: sensor histidine kinase [Acidimicrobiales bacterium]
MEAGRVDQAEAELDRGLLTGVAAFRWATWVWMAVVGAIDAANDAFAHPWAALALIGLALAFTAWATIMVRTRPTALVRPAALALELALAGALVFGDQWVYGGSHAQSLGSAWPLASVLSVAIVGGAWAGASAGFALGTLHWLSDLVFVAGRWTGNRAMGAWGTVVLFTLTGAIAGFVATRLRDAERRVATARAREEVARTLHDGVLQTLAVVQRRSDDPDLVGLAREQELELREFLFGLEPGRSELGPALRQAAAKAERHHRLRVSVILAEEPKAPDAVVRALAGAVSEALTNATKHGGATHATVYVEQPDDGGLFCSVKDDGRGFDEAATPEGIGIARSIRGRLDEVGGRVEVDGRPGRGTEVRLWVP